MVLKIFINTMQNLMQKGWESFATLLNVKNLIKMLPMPIKFMYYLNINSLFQQISNNEENKTQT